MLLAETQSYIDKRLNEIINGNSHIEDIREVTEEKSSSKESVPATLSSTPNFEDIRNKIKSKYPKLEENSVEFLSNAEYFYELNVQGMVDYSHIAINYFKVMELELNNYLYKEGYTQNYLPLGELAITLGRNLKYLKSLNDVHEVIKGLLDYRNDSAHAGIISKAKLREVRSSFFDKGVLTQILNLK